MKKKTSLLLALMLAALMLMTAGCGGPASEEAQTQTVTGMGGVEVTLPKEVKTIVDTWSAATDNLFNPVSYTHLHPWYFVGRSANRSCAALGLTSTPMWLPLGGFRTRGFWMCQRGIPACQSWQRRCCPCWIQPNGSPWNRRLTLPAWRGIP